MKKLIGVLALALFAVTAQAKEEPKKELTPQQQRMKQCNADAKGKSGAERKTFMKECLGGKTSAAAAAASAPATQQDKMKLCNVDAKGKSGAERKAFMKECLSNKG